MSQCLLFSTGNRLKLLQFCSNSILFKQIVCKILIFKTPFMASCLLITVLSVREMSQRSKNSLKIRGNSYNARTFQKYNDKVERTILFRQIHEVIPSPAFVQSRIAFSACGLSRQTKSVPFRTIPK